MLIGGTCEINDPKKKETVVKSTNDVYSLKIEKDLCIWKKQEVSGAFPERFEHTATPIPDKRIVVFGGFSDSNLR